MQIKAVVFDAYGALACLLLYFLNWVMSKVSVQPTVFCKAVLLIPIARIQLLGFKVIV
jgi:hypothetical protein